MTPTMCTFRLCGELAGLQQDYVQRDFRRARERPVIGPDEGLTLIVRGNAQAPRAEITATAEWPPTEAFSRFNIIARPNLDVNRPMGVLWRPGLGSGCGAAGGEGTYGLWDGVEEGRGAGAAAAWGG